MIYKALALGGNFIPGRHISPSGVSTTSAAIPSIENGNVIIIDSERSVERFVAQLHYEAEDNGQTFFVAINGELSLLKIHIPAGHKSGASVNHVGLAPGDLVSLYSDPSNVQRVPVAFSLEIK
jgi:hypothetical protein